MHDTVHCSPPLYVPKNCTELIQIVDFSSKIVWNLSSIKKWESSQHYSTCVNSNVMCLLAFGRQYWDAVLFWHSIGPWVTVTVLVCNTSVASHIIVWRQSTNDVFSARCYAGCWSETVSYTMTYLHIVCVLFIKHYYRFRYMSKLLMYSLSCKLVYVIIWAMI